jgi:hypothetical protein
VAEKLTAEGIANNYADCGWPGNVRRLEQAINDLIEQERKAERERLGIEHSAELRRQAAASYKAGEAAERERCEAEIAEARKILSRLVEEVDFVLSGGDDPCGRCGECGLAGVGMLRDQMKPARAYVARTKPSEQAR